jgi:hypothetical protein
MVLDEQAIAEVYCPKCSQEIETERDNRVWDNGWVLELNMDIVRIHANVMETSAEEITAMKDLLHGWESHQTILK